MTSCRACGAGIGPFMSFGQQPIANAYVSPGSDRPEYFYEMAVGVCPSCSLFQLIDQPDPDMMFHENYAFFSQTSKDMQRHFGNFAKSVQAKYLSGADPFVVEIGSNDGIMLKHFKAMGVRHLGVEPSRNVADIAMEDGIETVCDFFLEDSARRLAEAYGKADAILSANVICHIPDLAGVAKGVRAMLKPGGVFVFEDPYLGAVLEKTSYDQIYDEHVFLFSATSVRNAFAPHGLALVDIAPQTTHGGSMRYVLGLEGEHAPTAGLEALLAEEGARGFARPETFAAFARSCERSRDGLVALLRELAGANERVVGYAATAKSSTVLNYCGIGPELIDYISDTTPIKQGKLSPGRHVPIRPYEDFLADDPNYAILFAWNHRAEIMEKETGYMKRGGKWIVFVPEPRIE